MWNTRHYKHSNKIIIIIIIIIELTATGWIPNVSDFTSLQLKNPWWEINTVKQIWSRSEFLGLNWHESRLVVDDCSSADFPALSVRQHIFENVDCWLYSLVWETAKTRHKTQERLREQQAGPLVQQEPLAQLLRAGRGSCWAGGLCRSWRI